MRVNTLSTGALMNTLDPTLVVKRPLQRQRGEIVVKELTPSLSDDFLLFFDHVAFADNPEWSDRYCSLYHFANNKGKAESRRQASSQLEDDRIHGFLAFDMESPLAGITLLPAAAIQLFTG